MDDGRIRDATSGFRGGTPRARAESRPRRACSRCGEPSASRPQALPAVRQRPGLPDGLASGRRLQLGPRAALPRMPDGARRVSLSRGDAPLQPAPLPKRGGADPRGRGADAPVRRRRRGVLQRPGRCLERGSHPPDGLLRLFARLRRALHAATSQAPRPAPP